VHTELLKGRVEAKAPQPGYKGEKLRGVGPGRKKESKYPSGLTSKTSEARLGSHKGQVQRRRPKKKTVSRDWYTLTQTGSGGNPHGVTNPLRRGTKSRFLKKREK